MKTYDEYTQSARDGRGFTPPHGDALLRPVAEKRNVAPHSGTVRVVRISFAVPVETARYNLWQRRVALYLQERFALIAGAPLDLGLSFGYGVGEWGVEDCVHVETATPHDFTQWLVQVLRFYQQTCAYVSFNGSEAWELTAEGQWNPITGR